MRVLLSEGSGLTSRQVATRLGNLGHHVEILSSSQICLTRFTRYVRKVHLVPRFGLEPLAWLDAAKAIAKARAIDLLFPTQEQVAVLSARRETLDVATVVPAFPSLRRVQDKISAARTLQDIGVPQPASVIVGSMADLDRVSNFPAFVKRPISTASSGVRRVSSKTELERAAKEMGLGEQELLVQSHSSGPLAMIQAVADNGRLVAHHANLRIREGAGGGASLKESVTLPLMPEILERMVRALNWHGALSMDVIVTPAGPVVIDVNPRLVEPMNAYFAGVDLVSVMLDLAQASHPALQRPGKAGVRSRQLLLAILGAAQHDGTRSAILRELVAVLYRRGEYAAADEELTPLHCDPIAAVPVIVAILFTLFRPSLWQTFQSGAVGQYSLTPQAWDQIVSAAAIGAAPLPG
ncbi:MAG TPA: ATP-grasp domain-containing protein [Xanthobacteraceae bacterium]|nr:ATP-grasp domain-containing protein [Xanthobacteraceae bacterium]